MNDERDPVSEAAWYLDSGYPAEALECLRDADLTDPRVAYVRARTLIALGRDAEASEVVQTALSLDPENIYLFEVLAYSQIHSDALAAEATIRKGLAIQPDSAELLGAYVHILLVQGRFEAAERVLERLMRIAPDEEATHRVRTAFMLRASGSSEAVEATREFLRNYPDDAFAHYVNGLALLGGPWWRGHRHLREAAALRPQDPLLVETARVMRSWYLWPVYLTSGVVHWVITAVLFAAVIIDLVRDGTMYWKLLLLSIAITGYKWAALIAARLAIARRVTSSRN